ncbi:MAG: 4'-phosphopantetheinyl transferase superfamily protein [Paludibacteraceae bacterium]|nr:4'-phosphopantetheinyl transferase superfamily protein [Paludibacteraceae bacterium]
MDYLVFDDMNSCSEEAVARLLPLVSDQRREYALRYKHTFGQFCALQSWLMLKQLLAKQHFNLSEATLLYNPYGKPYIPDYPQFSISHCRNAIAVAVDTHPVGIDVESPRNISDDLIAYTMSEDEQARIHNADRPIDMFLHLWTRKEAYLKAQGTGINNRLQHTLEPVDEKNFTTIATPNYTLSVYRHV